MNKTQLIREVAKKSQTTQKVVKEVVAAQEEVIIEALQKGEKVSLMGFGTYSTAHREARERRNPLTGEYKMVEAYDVPKLKFSAKVKKIFRP